MYFSVFKCNSYTLTMCIKEISNHRRIRIFPVFQLLIFFLEHTNCRIIFFALEKTNKKCTFYFILFFFFVLILFCVSRETTKQNKICQKKIRDKFFFSIQHMFQSILSKKNQVHNFYKQKYEFEHHGQMLTFNIFKLTTFLTITILNSYHSYVKHF